MGSRVQMFDERARLLEIRAPLLVLRYVILVSRRLGEVWFLAVFLVAPVRVPWGK